MFVTLKNLWNNEDGATAIEYGLIAALIAVAAIASFQLVGTNLSNTFHGIATQQKSRFNVGDGHNHKSPSQTPQTMSFTPP
jgi:pilus assembly protein Flp/PilA